MNLNPFSFPVTIGEVNRMDLSWVELVVAVVLPVLVGLVTKEVTSSGVKAVLLAALSALARWATLLLTPLVNVGMSLGRCGTRL